MDKIFLFCFDGRLSIFVSFCLSTIVRDCISWLKRMSQFQTLILEFLSILRNKSHCHGSWIWRYWTLVELERFTHCLPHQLCHSRSYHRPPQADLCRSEASSASGHLATASDDRRVPSRIFLMIFFRTGRRGPGDFWDAHSAIQKEKGILIFRWSHFSLEWNAKDQIRSQTGMLQPEQSTPGKRKMNKKSDA